MNDRYQLILGDCIEKMKDLESGSVDAVITDPPYGINYLSTWTPNHHKLENDADEDIGKLYAKFLPEVKRLLKPRGVVACCCGGGGARPSSALATIKLIKHFELIQTLIWSKGKTDGSFVGLGWRYRPSYETVLIGARDRDDYAFYGKPISNVFVCKPHIPQKGDHPTQKPLRLMEFLILKHTLEGDIILDPFAGGGGTTGVAALRLNRRFIGIEKDEGYFKIAEKRISGEAKQEKLGAQYD